MLKLMKKLKPFRFFISLVILLIFLQVLADLYLPTLMAEIVDYGIVNEDLAFIWKTGGIMLLIAGLGVACAVSASYFSAKVAIGFSKKLREELFRKITDYSLEQFDEIGTASLITRTTNDVNQIQRVLMVMLRMVVMAPIMIIGGIIMALSRDTKLTLVFLIAVPILALVIFLVVKYVMPLFKALQKKLDKLNLVVRENLTGIRVVRAFNRDEFETEKFVDANLDLTKTTILVNRIMSGLMPIMMLTVNLSIVAIVWFGSVRVDKGSLQVGDMMAFIQYAMLILMSLMMMSMMFVLIPRASVSAERINAVLQLESTIVDRKSARDKPIKEGRVEFSELTFSYPGAEQAVLRNLSFRANPGEVTAIIGGTGSGKTTLIQLIPRFYDADSGQILIDGLDVKDYSQEALREAIGYVPQQTTLFTGTVAENIRYGKGLARDKEVEQAAERSVADEFIKDYPEEYEAEISQGGANLSGGQKQRLAIARALVRKPKIYLFDDSFSALDYKTDAQVRSNLKKETQDATVIVVAQRISTVIDADKIIVLHEGEIVGQGSHDQLSKTNEVYKEIVISQLTEEAIS